MFYALITAHNEAAMAKLVTEGAINAWAQIESKLAQVQSALVLAEEAHQRVEFEHEAAQEALKKAEEVNDLLVDEKVTLIIELGALKDDFVPSGIRLLLIGRR